LFVIAVAAILLEISPPENGPDPPQTQTQGQAEEEEWFFPVSTEESVVTGQGWNPVMGVVVGVKVWRVHVSRVFYFDGGKEMAGQVSEN